MSDNKNFDEKKKVLNEEQLNEANGGTVLAKKAVANDDELDSVCGGAGKTSLNTRDLGII